MNICFTTSFGEYISSKIARTGISFSLWFVLLPAAAPCTMHIHKYYKTIFKCDPSHLNTILQKKNVAARQRRRRVVRKRKMSRWWYW